MSAGFVKKLKPTGERPFVVRTLLARSDNGHTDLRYVDIVSRAHVRVPGANGGSAGEGRLVNRRSTWGRRNR